MMHLYIRRVANAVGAITVMILALIVLIRV
jgi:hypothetical protein